MIDLNPPALMTEPGERLVRADYKRDFKQRKAEIRGRSSWKLERRQHFEEQDVPSWEAMRRGDWEQSLRLLRGQGETFRTAARNDSRQTHAFHRVRVVEQPLTSYLQWEMHVLRHQAEYGRRIRVVPAECVADAERYGLLPEIVVLGGRTLYRVTYSDAGRHTGAELFTDPKLVRGWEHYLENLYERGEDVISYFDREVAHLPAPQTQPE